jgi:hypothetical protein
LAELAPQLKIDGRPVAELVKALGDHADKVRKKGALFWRETTSG